MYTNRFAELIAECVCDGIRRTLGGIRKDRCGHLRESFSRELYHFLEFKAFSEIVISDSFTTSDMEEKFNGNGTRFMSFSRTKSFREGYPVIMYSGYDGKGDDWCAIRLTVDGDLMNTRPNYHSGDGARRRYNMKGVPFDYIYNSYDRNEEDLRDTFPGTTGVNGKEVMMSSDAVLPTLLPLGYTEISDIQGHPYSQAEDRLLTKGERIPHASDFIKRVDILLMPYCYNDRNAGDRHILYDLIKNNVNGYGDKICLYDDMRELEIDGEQVTPEEILYED